MKTKRVNIKGHVPLPTNLEEAFDMVEWDFLIYPMRTMGFGAKWRAWNKECVSTATYSILINGSPKCFFSTHRGLHMGDPLSSFLFTIVGEALSRMLSKAENCNLIEGHQSPTFNKQMIPCYSTIPMMIRSKIWSPFSHALKLSPAST